MDDNKVGILKTVLKRGKANALHQIEVADALGLPAWKVKRLVRKARTLGVKIISGNKGYYIANTPSEFEQFEHMMLKQANSRYSIIEDMKKG